MLAGGPTPRPETRGRARDLTGVSRAPLGDSRNDEFVADQTGAWPRVSTKITVIYDNPQSEDAFEGSYAEQLNLAKAVPGVLRMEASKVWPKEDRSPTPAYRLLDLYFADYAAASEAVTTPESDAWLTAVMEAATGGVRIVFADVEDSVTFAEQSPERSKDFSAS